MLPRRRVGWPMSPRLAPADAEYVRALVQRVAAIHLDESKHYLLETRLERLAQQLGCDGTQDLVGRARKGVPHLDTHIVEAITTHETSFFRDVQPFEVLRQHVIPALVALRQRQRALRFWSAGCSTGQEAYSLAMLVRDAFPALREWAVSILATDLSHPVVQRAASGRFSQLEVNRGLPAARLLQHFHREGLEWVINPATRALVEFRQMNLLHSWGLGAPLDVIMLRNVLIYFDQATKRSVLQRVRQWLAPGGVLFLGAAETTLTTDDGAWERVQVGSTSYYRVRP